MAQKQKFSANTEIDVVFQLKTDPETTMGDDHTVLVTHDPLKPTVFTVTEPYHTVFTLKDGVTFDDLNCGTTWLFTQEPAMNRGRYGRHNHISITPKREGYSVMKYSDWVGEKEASVQLSGEYVAMLDAMYGANTPVKESMVDVVAQLALYLEENGYPEPRHTEPVLFALRSNPIIALLRQLSGQKKSNRKSLAHGIRLAIKFVYDNSDKKK